MRIAGLTMTAASLGASVALAQAPCSALLQPACLQQLGAGSETALVGDCKQQLDNYRGCLADAAANSSRGRDEPQARCSEARAARLWSDAKSSNSCIALKSFRDACPASPEASFAKGVMQQMGCRKGDLAAPSGAPEGEAAAEGGASGQLGPYDGVWVAIVANNEICRHPGGRIVLKISGEEVTGKTGDGRDFKGSIARDGEISFTGPNAFGNVTAVFKGRLSGDSGAGENVVGRRGCRGTVEFKRF